MAMGEEEEENPASSSPPPPPPNQQTTLVGDALPPPLPPTSQPSQPSPRLQFDPSRMIGIIRRKAMIKDLAALYHAECLAYCRELLELQRKWEEFSNVQQQFMDIKAAEDIRKETRPTKRSKKTR